MKKRAIALAMSAMMMTATLAGCGTQQQQQPPTTAPETTPATADGANPTEAEVVEVAKADDSAVGNLIAATTGPVKLTVWASEEDQDLTKELISKFEAQYPDVTFDIQLGACSESTAKDNVLSDPTAYPMFTTNLRIGSLTIKALPFWAEYLSSEISFISAESLSGFPDIYETK